MDHQRESKDTFDLIDNDQPPVGGFGQLEFIERRRPPQENDHWGNTRGTSATNDPWTDPKRSPQGQVGSPQGHLELRSPPTTADNQPTTSASRTVHFGEINPAFVGDEANKTPVYSSENGRAIISHEHVVQTDQDGLRVVVTSHRQTWRETEKAIKEKDLKILKIFSIIAIILFFPTGIAALYYARRTFTEFHAGFLRGELDTARKMAKRCEKLIILSVMAALLIAVLVFVIIENGVNKTGGESNKYDSTFGKRAP